MKITHFAIVLFCLIGCNSDNQNDEYPKNCQEGTIILNGASLRYHIEGEGIPCLVIGSSVYYPRTFSEDIKKNLKMYFIDLRWFSEDHIPVNLEEYDIPSIADDIEAVRSELGLDSIIALGHSIHGTIAFEYARRYPEHINGLVMIGSPNIFGNEIYDNATLDIWETASNKRRELQNHNWTNLGDLSKLSGTERVIANYHAMAPKYWYDPNYDVRWLWEGVVIDETLMNYMYGTIFKDYDMFREESSIPVPTLVVLGKHDYVIPYTLWHGYDVVPGLTIKLFEKSGHTPQLEESNKFDKVVFKWICENQQ